MDPFNVAGDSACAISSFLINQYAYSVTIIIIIYIRISTNNIIHIIVNINYTVHTIILVNNAYITVNTFHLAFPLLTKCLWFGLTCYIFEELVFILKLIAKE